MNDHRVQWETQTHTHKHTSSIQWLLCADQPMQSSWLDACCVSSPAASYLVSANVSSICVWLLWQNSRCILFACDRFILTAKVKGCRRIWRHKWRKFEQLAQSGPNWRRINLLLLLLPLWVRAHQSTFAALLAHFSAFYIRSVCAWGKKWIFTAARASYTHFSLSHTHSGRTKAERANIQMSIVCVCVCVCNQEAEERIESTRKMLFINYFLGQKKTAYFFWLQLCKDLI